jgi:hypothetical protein
LEEMLEVQILKNIWSASRKRTPLGSVQRCIVARLQWSYIAENRESWRNFSMPIKSAGHALPVKNLKRAFECAVRDMYQVGLTGQVSRYRSPIVQRGATAPGSNIDAEKRALSDAAKALARLWNVAPTSTR